MSIDLFMDIEFVVGTDSLIAKFVTLCISYLRSHKKYRNVICCSYDRKILKFLSFKSLRFLLIWNFIIWSIMQEKANSVL